MRLVLVVLLALAAPPLLAQPAAKDGGKAAGAKPMPPMPVKAVAAKVAPAIDEVSAVGNLRADEAITIRPEIAGRIVVMPFKEGESVQKGARLLALDSAELRAVVASSDAQAKLDAQRQERNEDLFRKGFISQQALDESRSNLSRSRAKFAEDSAKLARTEIHAPFAGVVGLRQVSEGAFVAAGTDIARLEKIDQLKLDFRVPENYVSRLRNGQAVRLQVDAWSTVTFSGAVFAIEPGIDEQTRTVQVRARVANADLKLRPGMFARVYLTLGTRDKAVWIPEAAVVPRGPDSFVFRVVDGKAMLVKISTGVRKVGEVEVLQGLSGGDLVVTDGTQRLAPGAPVNLMGAEKPAAASGPAPKAAPKGGG
jgi:membrane fusion protein, multidrug efflux system